MSKKTQDLQGENKQRKGNHRILFGVARIILTPLLKLLYFYEFTNKNTLPKDGGFIICCNHISYIDPIFVALGQKRRVRFMAKSELFKNKIFSKIITSLGAFPVVRGAGDSKAIDYSEEIIKHGGVLCIFIEGTRSKTGDLQRPRSGAALIAMQANMPVVPMCITPKGGGKMKIFRKTKITYGEPILPEELGLEDGSRTQIKEASHRIMGEIKKIREVDMF